MPRVVLLWGCFRGLGFGGLGFKVWDLELRVYGLGCFSKPSGLLIRAACRQHFKGYLGFRSLGVVYGSGCSFRFIGVRI